ncbi:hypothetical protein [Methylobrevis pamukkalensis]|uniref:Uncharacterized protein n=1 Tax=Methylobrevis pamukkalensis TaxID=1439726 RepID=A0A1E3H3M1_9HYPH|nr:hypothetical protein [Methylobrevis pamukkalensis]ODN70912.1 hypothetical protein A6302_01756 [Methylobrevis pamukkalensis]
MEISGSNQRVVWSVARNDSALTKGAASPAPIPDEVAIDGRQVIVTRVRYRYESPLSSFMSAVTGSDGYDLEHVFMQHPRIGTAVNYQ